MPAYIKHLLERERRCHACLRQSHRPNGKSGGRFCADLSPFL